MPRAGLTIILTLVLATQAQAQASGNTHINPPGLSAPTSYTHVVVAADHRTIYIAGQVALDSTGALVGKGDFRAQTEQVFRNLRVALASVGATFADVVKATTYITDSKQVPSLREVRTRYLDPKRLPASTLVVVSALAQPDFLVEIELIAVLRSPWPSVHRHLDK